MTSTLSVRCTDFEGFAVLIVRAKKRNYKRSPDPKLLRMMDPEAKVLIVSSDSTRDPVRCIFQVKLEGVAELVPVHIDLSPADFQSLAEVTLP